MIRDTFGNQLAPGTYFTYVVADRYAHLRIGKVPEPGQKMKLVCKCWGDFALFNGRPNDMVLALDASLVPDRIKEMLT